LSGLISVLVVDDQLVQREGIVRVVEATGKMHVVGAASNAEEAQRVVENQLVELALIDLVLHDQNGTQVGRDLRNLRPEIKVIIYTREKSMVLASEIFREQKELSQPGLQGYLLTRNISSSDYLLQIYRQIQSSGYFIDPDVLRWHYRFAELEKPTPREEECALLIAKGLSNVQIAERMVVSRRRVENLINSLYQKFRILGDPGDPARRVVLVESIRLLAGYRTPAKILSVLIVEDQAEQRARLQREFDVDERFSVLAAVDEGQRGIDLACETRPDIALVDIRLPDLDGFQVARQILQNLPKTRVILISAEDSAFYREAAMKAGVIAFLPKKSLSSDKIFVLYHSSGE
jgi:DNA-binding NarL/FixJ family response regulator